MGVITPEQPLEKNSIPFISSAAIMQFCQDRKMMAVDCMVKLPGRRKGNDREDTIVDYRHY